MKNMMVKLGIIGLLLGLPISYFFQSPIIKIIIPFSEYIKTIPQILTLSPSQMGEMGTTLIENPTVVVIATCLVSAFLLVFVGYIFDKQLTLQQKKAVKEFLKKNTLLLALILVVALFHILIVTNNKGSLFAPRNITNLLSQNAYVMILATGMLLCILTGGNIDLSVGSQVNLIAAIGAILLVRNGMSVYAVIPLCLLCGILLGAWQAFWIAYMRIPPFIVTLAGMLAFRGLALVLLGGLTISPIPASFTRYFGSYMTGGGTPEARLRFSLMAGAAVCVVVVLLAVYSRINKIRKNYAVEPIAATVVKYAVVCAAAMFAFYSFGRDRGVPVVLILVGVVVLFYHYFTSKTVPGRYLYALGGNEKAARLSGVNTEGMMFFAYTNMGFLSAVAAMVCLARFGSSFPGLGRSFELDAIGSNFIGGASAYGGVGTVGGALIGSIFLGVINNGMSILGVDQNWQEVVKGMVLLAAVIWDILSKKRRNA